MNHQKQYEAYVAAIVKRHGNSKVAVSYEKWLPLHKAGLA